MPSYFVDRGIKPKRKRSLTKLHKIWQKTLEREKRYNALAYNVMNDILIQIEPNEKNVSRVYSFVKDGLFTFDVFKKKDAKEIISYMRNYIGEKYIDRKMYLEIAIDNNALILGEKLHFYDNLSKTNISEIAFKYFWHELEKKLSTKAYKELIVLPAGQKETIIKINLCSKVYLISVLKDYSYYKFKWYGIESNVEIKMR